MNSFLKKYLILCTFVGLLLFVGCAISAHQEGEDKVWAQKATSFSLGADLDETNSELEQAKDDIDEASSNAWSNYYDMGNALDSLYYNNY
jgi:hypothetical protein